MNAKQLCLAAGLVWMAGGIQSSEKPVFIRGIRPLGMGGAFTAAADDQNMFFYNPAGSILRNGPLTTVLEIPVTMGSDLWETKKFLDDNIDDLKKFDELSNTRQAELVNKISRDIATLDPNFAVGLPNTNYISGPSASRWHWGVGYFGQVSGSFRIDTDIVPNVSYDVTADAQPLFHLSKAFGTTEGPWGRWGVGLNAKYLSRGAVKDEKVSFLELENYDDPPVQWGRGFGLDLGALYQPNTRWTFGLANLDVGGTSLSFDSVDAKKGFEAKPSRDGVIKPRWDLGVAWVPTKIGIQSLSIPTYNRFRLALDVRDVANSDSKVLFDGNVVADTLGKHIHMGVEYAWWIFRLRAGANQGYPTLGAGVDWPFLKLDYAFYTDELSRFPGVTPQHNHMFSLAFRWGTAHTDYRTGIKNAKEQAKQQPGSQEKTAAPAPEKPAAPGPVSLEKAVPPVAPTETSSSAPSQVPGAKGSSVTSPAGAPGVEHASPKPSGAINTPAGTSATPKP